MYTVHANAHWVSETTLVLIHGHSSFNGRLHVIIVTACKICGNKEIVLSGLDLHELFLLNEELEILGK